MKVSLNLFLIILLYINYIIAENTVLCKTISRLRTHRKLFNVKRARSIERGIKDITTRNCGLKPTLNYIIGGEETVVNEFPFIVSLQYDFYAAVGLESNFSHRCGGSIINKWWILTAAHCLTFLEIKEYSNTEHLVIITGAHQHLNGGQMYKISNIIIHKKYDRGANNNLAFDIALIRVNRQIKFNSKVNSICLPTKPYSEPHGMMTVIGWGWYRWYKNIAQPAEPLLNKVNLEIISDQKCANMFADVWRIYRSYICAFSTGKSGCYADSGGPAFQYKNGRAVLLGIVSFGSLHGCNGPTSFTQVSYYLHWISSQIHSAEKNF